MTEGVKGSRVYTMGDNLEVALDVALGKEYTKSNHLENPPGLFGDRSICACRTIRQMGASSGMSLREEREALSHLKRDSAHDLREQTQRKGASHEGQDKHQNDAVLRD